MDIVYSIFDTKLNRLGRAGFSTSNPQFQDITQNIRSGQVMGWGMKAIEIRSVRTGALEGVFMHKRAQKMRFLCERNNKVCLEYLLGVLGGLIFDVIYDSPTYLIYVLDSQQCTVRDFITIKKSLILRILPQFHYHLFLLSILSKFFIFRCSLRQFEIRATLKSTL